MSQLLEKRLELKDIDMLSSQDSVVHRLHPLSKFLVTILYIVIVISFPKYNFSGLLTMILYPIVMFQLAVVPIRTCFIKLKVVLPLVCAVGIVNPFLDHTPILQLGNITITGGVVSMLTLMMKGVFSLMSSYLLIATTSIDSICGALRRIHVPDMMVTLLLLTYRYVGMMMDEVGVMYDAYMLRAPGQKGIHISAWGSFLGQLLLRTIDRGEELYNSMLLRGYKGEFPHAKTVPFQLNSLLYFLISLFFFLMARGVNFAATIGNLLMR